MTARTILVLGGGISGIATAWKLVNQNGNRVILLEREAAIGGLASTFSPVGPSQVPGLEDVRVDIGSHRIHTTYDPEAFPIIRKLLGDDLLKRPRRGLILINGKFVKYPPSVIQICACFGLAQTAAFIVDYLFAQVKTLLLGCDRRDFASYVIRSVGNSLYDVFYRPYATKLWGLDPHRVSFEPAMNRVKKFEMRCFLMEVANLFRRKKADPIYFYPARGIGQIAERMREQFLELGGEIRCSVDVDRIETSEERRVSAVNFHTGDGRRERVPVDVMVSTIPLETIHSLITLGAENRPAYDLHMKCARICYLLTKDVQPRESETLYIPDTRYRVGRVSDVKKYSPAVGAGGAATVLTAELICQEGDDVWTMSDQALGELCARELCDMGVLKPGAVIEHAFSRRVRNLYPV
ncbi:MAG: FAD-dependent oxidoreductase [Elusimicrobia bacterium]|nr:FAD-dependent oxidoreductase [Elusimicrobiota bacterium]